MHRLIALSASILTVGACSSPSPVPPIATPPASPATALHDAVLGTVVEALDELPDPRRWFAGDVHMHVTPPDDPTDVSLSVHEIATRARSAGMDFVVLTPHVWPARWSKAFRREWKQLAETARAETLATMIPGVEWTTRDGHFTVTGIDLATLGDGSFLPAAHAAGAWISVNHPFAVPTKIPGVRASHVNMSYRVWTDGLIGFTAIDGVEVMNLPLAIANLISRPGGQTGEERAWRAASLTALAHGRRIAAVGGTDNHKLHVAPTTWVLATDASERAILDGLRAGATCVGGTDGGALRIHGDADAPDSWGRIGDAVLAPRLATLAWDGTARLFIDGVDRGEHPGGYLHATDGRRTTYRIEQGASRCGFVYANL